MTVFDLPMSYVYAGVAFGCFLMLIRQAAKCLAQCADRVAPADMDASDPTRLRGRTMRMIIMAFLFIAVLLVGVPVFIALAGSSFVYTHFIAELPDFVILHRMAGGIDSFPLLAVPFFILAGNLMNSAGITNRIYDFAVALAGWTRGGLAHVNIIGSVIFAGMSGTAIADAAGLGTIEIKAMQDHGYDTEFSVGVTAASSTLGPIIPPSLPFVIYGMMGNVSIGALFLGGVIPGFVMTAFMMGYVYYCARRYGMGRDQAFRWRTLGTTFLAAFPGAADAGDHRRRHDIRMVHADRGGDRRLRLGDGARHISLSHAVSEAVLQGLDGHYRDHGRRVVDRRRCLAVRLGADDDARHRIHHRGAAGPDQQSLHHSVADQRLAAGVGCFLEPIASISILVPVLMPVIVKVGIDPVHFGVMMTLNLMIGLLHPPLGMVLFVLSRIAKLSIERTTMAILPWLIPLLLSLIAITMIPELTLWLPRVVGMIK